MGTHKLTASLKLMQISHEREPVPYEKIVAVGLLTQREVEMLGHGFSRLWPIDESPCFSELLQRIDEADREVRRETGHAGAGASKNSGTRKASAKAVLGGGRY